MKLMKPRYLRQSTRDIESRVLQLLADGEPPLGSSTIQHALSKDGVIIGEATIGRLLRRFDERGFTLKHGKRGRTLTNVGLRHLQSLLRDHDRRASGLEFLSTLNAASPVTVLDVLVSRRAIERETATLAAFRAREADVMALRRIQSEHERSKVEGDSAVVQNRDFHLTIARIGGNRVLETALDLLLNEFALSEHVVQVREIAGAQLGIEHPRIIDAIALRNPSQAASEMAEHINQIIRDVFRTYEDTFRRDQRDLQTYLSVP
jgi:GntR family transcriptional regulator, transcriptional repressor for pyruvate dehydrogenase complex